MVLKNAATGVAKANRKTPNTSATKKIARMISTIDALALGPLFMAQLEHSVKIAELVCQKCASWVSLFRHTKVCTRMWLSW